MAVMQEAQRLRWVRDQVAASTGRQLSDAQCAEAAGLRSAEALDAALRDGANAAKRLIREHKGFLVSLSRKFTRQVQTLTVQHMHTALPQCTHASRFTDSKTTCFPKVQDLATYRDHAESAAVQCHDDCILLE